MRYALDIETTGLDPMIDRVASIAFVPIGDAEGALDVMIRPDGWTMPAAASAVNGLDDLTLLVNGESIGMAIGKMFELLEDATEVWAHNAKFDVAFLRAEAERCGYSDPFEGIEIRCTGLETRNMMGLADAFRSDGSPRIAKLSAVIERISGPQDVKYHNAWDDAECVAFIAEWLDPVCKL